VSDWTINQWLNDQLQAMTGLNLETSFEVFLGGFAQALLIDYNKLIANAHSDKNAQYLRLLAYSYHPFLLCSIGF
jgi:hypothetical protein